MKRTPHRRAAHTPPFVEGAHAHSAQHLDHGHAKHLAQQIRATGRYLAWPHLLAPGTWGVQVSDRSVGGIIEFACRDEWQAFCAEPEVA